MSMDFNIRSTGAPAPVVPAQPAGDAARDAVATQLPASRAVTAADASAHLRSPASGPHAGTSHQTVFDRDAATMVYQVVDNRSSLVVRQFPDDAMLRRRAYFHAIDMLKDNRLREPAADRTA